MVFVALSLLIIQSSPVLTRMTNTIMNVIRVRIVLMAVLQENPDLLFFFVSHHNKSENILVKNRLSFFIHFSIRIPENVVEALEQD